PALHLATLGRMLLCPHHQQIENIDKDELSGLTEVTCGICDREHRTTILLGSGAQLQKCPKYLLLENVKGFESSSARNELLRTLETCGFKYQEFLLSPTCLGIPNSRLRYFLIAKLHHEPFFFHVPGQILTRFPDQNLEELSKDKVVDKTSSSFPSGEKSLDSNTGPDCSSKKEPLPKGAFLFKLETAEQMVRKHRQDNDPSIQMLEDFLEEENEEMSQYFLAPKSLVRYAFLLDIVKPTCRRSTCFTKG
ncbi:hypothetical protein CIB84_009264, partial [Bambusicola thoracicus]